MRAIITDALKGLKIIQSTLFLRYSIHLNNWYSSSKRGLTKVVFKSVLTKKLREQSVRDYCIDFKEDQL